MLAKQCYRQTFSGEFTSTIVRHTDVIVLHFSFWGRGTRTLHFRPAESSWNLLKKKLTNMGTEEEAWTLIFFGSTAWSATSELIVHLLSSSSYDFLRFTAWKTFPWLDAFSWVGKPRLSVSFLALYLLSNALPRSEARSCWDHS